MVLRQRPSNLLVLGGMLAAFLIAATFRWLTLAEFSNDHFDHVALAQQVRLGALPVRDFTDEGMPLTYLVSALAWTLVKTPFLAEGIVVVIGFALTAAVSFRTAARASQSLAAAALAAAAQVALYPRTYSYPKLLVQAIAVAVAWWAVERLTGRPVPPTCPPEPWRRWKLRSSENGPVAPKLRSSEGGRIAALSAATALGYYFRHDHALYLGLAMIALLVAANWRTGWSTVARSLTLYAALVAAFVLPHLAYVQWAAGVPTYFAISREYVKAEAGGGAYRLPVPYVDVRAGLWLRADTPVVNVRWTPGVDDRSRTDLERRYQMEVVAQDEGTTWRYHMRDASPANLRAVRADSHVEDTHGFERLEAERRSRGWLTNIRPGPGWRARDNSLAVLFWLCWFLPALAVVMLVARRDPIPASDAAGVVMLAVLALGSNVGFLRSPLDVRLPDVAVPQTILAAWIGAAAWRWPASGSRRLLARSLVVIGTLTAFIATGLLSQTGTLLQATGLPDGVDGVARQWRRVTVQLRDDTPGPVPSNPSSILWPFFEYLRACTDREDRLLYAWYSPEVYVVADRGFAGDHRKFFAPFHASPWEQARTIARLRQQRVPFVVIPVERRQSFINGYPDVWQYLQNRYVPMTTIPPGDPHGFEILRESSWTSSRLYGTTDWPCAGSPAAGNHS